MSAGTRRDLGLDFIKVLACILMVVAHGVTLGRINEGTLSAHLWHFSLVAPVIFFIGFGLSLSYSVERHSVWALVNSLAVLFLISFAEIGAFRADYVTIQVPNLFGSLAISGFLFVVVDSLFKKRGGWPVMVVIGCLLLALDRYLNFWPHTPNLLHGDLFSIFPWAGLVLMAPILRHKKTSVFLLLIFLIAYWRLRFDYRQIDNQVASTNFLTLGWIFALLGYGLGNIVIGVSKAIKPMSWWLALISRNTLLFYVSHLILIRMIDERLPLILFLSLVLLIETVLIYFSEHLQTTNAFKHPGTEFGYLALALVILVFLPALAESWPIDNYSYFQIILLVYAVFRTRINKVFLT